MFEKLQGIKQRFDELSLMLVAPDATSDRQAWQALVKEHASLKRAAELYDEYEALRVSLKECEELSDGEDRELAQLARDEGEALIGRRSDLENEIKSELLPRDPDDDKNVIIEVRAGAGGEEAGLFGAQIVRMYMRFAERMRWKVKELDMNYTDLGGAKEVTFMISGNAAFGTLKYESGVHRVQRIPATESQGRIHTSTVTVAVLPETEDVDVEIADSDIKIDIYRSSGAGGQHVNKTESAIRITHFPTGIVVTCQDERSQLKNREQAMRVLKSRVYDYYRQKADNDYARNRRVLIGSGDRSEKIRTYNFPQNRVTDHRINFTMYNLEDFMDGNLAELLEALRLADTTLKLSSQTD